MEKKAILLDTTGVVPIDKRTAPDFLLLYQQSILLALKEQGILNEVQYGLCLDTLAETEANGRYRLGVSE